MIKSTLRDAAIIATSAIALGVVYNAAFSVKPLPWIRQPRIVDTVSTDALFRTLTPSRADTTQPSQNSAVTTASVPSTPKTDSTKQSIPPPSSQQSSAPRLPPKNDLTPPSDDHGRVRAVTYKQVRMMLRNEDVLFMDARRKDEYDSGHIPRALNVDIQLFELDPNYRNQIMQMLYSLDKRRPVVTYCGGGHCELSHRLSDLLVSIGFEHVFIYLGGWNEYSSKPDSPRQQ
ncbi:MAG: rhodanese-like domain-containing protein [Chlorobi bacterium]|nr:rhodanese-like domain-containing protein [Chlorobiota bacterium]